MNAGSSRVPFAILAASAGFLMLSWNEGHYWDEFFYLYSVLTHSPAELVRFEMRTEVFPVGFFSEKIGHVVLLDLLTGLLGGSKRSLYLVQGFYAALLVGFFAAAYGLLRDLLGDRRARDATLVLAFSPLGLYLGFKAMSEVPSLLFTTLGSWAFVRSFAGGAARGRATWLGLATVALTIGMLCRFTVIAAFVGLGVALLAAGDERFERRRLFLSLLWTVMGVVVLHSAALALVGGSVLRFGQHVHSVVTDHPPLQRAFALGLFVQSLALVLPFAWSSHAGARPWFAVLWLAASAFPFLAGHEPRYYAPAMVPLAVLAAGGLRAAADLLFPARPRHAWIGLLAGLVVVNRGLLIPLMPYEVEQGQLLAIFEKLQEHDPGATHLIPWTSDYSLLRFTFPDAHVALCLSGTPRSRQTMGARGGPLSDADRWWAGRDRYLSSRTELDAQARPWLYLGWTRSPSGLRLQALLGLLGLERLVLKGPPMHNHLAESWIWYDKSLKLTAREHLGQYYVYEVSPRAPGAAGLAP